MVFFLALRSLFLQRKRYILMAVAIVCGFTLVTVIHSAAYGALETVKAKAARYFAGHISITGYDYGMQILPDSRELIDLLRESDLPLRTISSRTVYFTDVSLFFAGESIRQRRLIGIDFTAEQSELSNLEFLEGSISNMLEKGQNGILISEAAADILGARVGDDVMIFLTTDTDQYNTATLYVQGIFRETSLFGYVAYMRQEDLNGLLLRAPDSATDIALYAEPGVNHEKLLREVRHVLISDKYRVLPYMPSKAALNTELSRIDWSISPVLAPLTLDAHLDQITTLLNAFMTITWFILAVFTLIVMVGILNTYRVLVYERTREIGTMRAIGMSQNAVRRMFLIEAALLALFSSAAGFVIAVLLMRVFNFITLDSLPGTGLFTDRGLLRPHIDPHLVGLTLFMMLAAVMAAAFGPANKASRIAPAEALRAEN